MSHEETKQEFTIVAFRYDRRRSVFYDHHTDPKDVAKDVLGCLMVHNADVISIRRVHTREPQTSNTPPDYI